MEKSYDVIVVGAGSIGMAAGYYLAKLGVRTLLLDRYTIPHEYGSHHGDTRLIRHAYRKQEYTVLAVRAQQLWEELERESGRELLLKTGIISAGLIGSAIEGKIENARKLDLGVSVLSAKEIHAQWPGINLSDDFIGLFEPEAGVLFNETCLKTYQELAISAGVSFLPNTVATQIEFSSDHVKVSTDKGNYYANKVLLSVGAWSKQMLSALQLELPLRPSRRTVGWFEANEDLFSSDVFPGFTIDIGNEIYYGFPSINGSGVKLGRHDGEDAVDPDLVDREFGKYAEDEGDIRNFLKKYMPQAEGSLKQGKVCMYTFTPDSDFIVDQHPENPHVLIAAGFSGHGFKFASVLGEIASELLTKGKTEADISMFSLKRFNHL